MMRWAADGLVSTGLLLALVMIIQRAVARQFGAGAAYALWLAPLVRLLVPPLAAPGAPPAILVETGAAASAALAPVSQAVPCPICALTDNDELKGRIAMMNQDHGTARRLAGRGIAAVLAGAGLAFSLPASAAFQDVAPKMTEIHKIIRIGDAPGHSESVDLSKCQGEKFEAGSAPTAGKQQRTKILLCNKPGANKAQSADALEKALARIQSESELTADSKAQIVGALQKRIAELRAGN